MSPCEFGANLFSGFRDIPYTNKKPQTETAKKQNLPQFTKCGNYKMAEHYIFILSFVLLLSSFFPRLISAAADWMSAILPHMMWP